MDAISLFFNHRSRLLWMLQGSKIILVTSRCTLLLFCVTVIGPVVGDCRNKCCCRKGRIQQGLPVGCVPALWDSCVSTATKHKVVAFIREIQITSELGKCTIVRGRENTQYLK